MLDWVQSTLHLPAPGSSSNQAGLNFNRTRQLLSSVDTAGISVAYGCIDKVPLLHHTENCKHHAVGTAQCSKGFVAGFMLHIIGRTFRVIHFPHKEKIQVYKILDNLLTWNISHFYVKILNIFRPKSSLQGNSWFWPRKNEKSWQNVEREIFLTLSLEETVWFLGKSHPFLLERQNNQFSSPQLSINLKLSAKTWLLRGVFKSLAGWEEQDMTWEHSQPQRGEHHPT